MHYTAKYFRDNFPEWKYRKDFILTKIFYRPVSFCLCLCVLCKSWNISKYRFSVLVIRGSDCMSHVPFWTL